MEGCWWREVGGGMLVEGCGWREVGGGMWVEGCGWRDVGGGMWEGCGWGVTYLRMSRLGGMWVGSDILEDVEVRVVLAGEVRVAAVRSDYVLLHCTLDAAPELPQLIVRHVVPEPTTDTGPADCASDARLHETLVA